MSQPDPKGCVYPDCDNYHKDADDICRACQVVQDSDDIWDEEE